MHFRKSRILKLRSSRSAVAIQNFMLTTLIRITFSRLLLYYFLNIVGSSLDNDVTKMEGCPRSLMLNVDLKETFPTEFTPSLKTVKQDKRVDFIFSHFLGLNPQNLRLFSVHP